MKLLKIADLKPHERTDLRRFRALFSRIRKDGILKTPVLVDMRTSIILDGHHRLECLAALGCKLAPVQLVDYLGKSVSVVSRNRKKALAKEDVLRAGQSGNLFPPRSSRHVYSPIPSVDVPLDFLR